MKFSKAVTGVLMAFHTVVFAVQLLHQFSSLCVPSWEAYCEDWREGSKTLIFMAQHSTDEDASWDDIIHGSPVDLPGFLVLFVSCSLMSIDHATTQRIRALHKHEIEACHREKEDAEHGPQAPIGSTIQKSKDVALDADWLVRACLLYTSPSPRDATLSRMPSSA